MGTNTIVLKRNWRHKVLAALIAIIMMVAFITFLVDGWANIELKSAMDETVGRQIVIGSDTLTITGYHVGRRVIKLSNGTEADMRIIPKLGLVPIGQETKRLD